MSRRTKSLVKHPTDLAEGLRLVRSADRPPLPPAVPPTSDKNWRRPPLDPDPLDVTPAELESVPDWTGREVSPRWALALLMVGGVSGLIAGLVIGLTANLVRLVFGG